MFVFFQTKDKSVILTKTSETCIVRPLLVDIPMDDGSGTGLSMLPSIQSVQSNYGNPNFDTSGPIYGVCANQAPIPVAAPKKVMKRNPNRSVDSNKRENSSGKSVTTVADKEKQY